MSSRVTVSSLVTGVLVAATATPLLVALRAGTRVLAGRLDADSYLGSGTGGFPVVTAVPSVVDRLGWMLSTVAFGTALTATAMGCLVLAGLSLRGRGAGVRLRLPARAAAVLIAVVCAATGLLVTAAALYDAYGPPTLLRQQLSQPPPSDGSVMIAVMVVPTPSLAGVEAFLVPAFLAVLAVLVLTRGFDPSRVLAAFGSSRRDR